MNVKTPAFVREVQEVKKRGNAHQQSPMIRYVAKKRLVKLEENERKRKIKEERDHEQLIHLLAASKPNSLIAKMRGKNGDSPIDKYKDRNEELNQIDMKPFSYYSDLHASQSQSSQLSDNSMVHRSDDIEDQPSKPTGIPSTTSNRIQSSSSSLLVPIKPEKIVSSKSRSEDNRKDYEGGGRKALGRLDLNRTNTKETNTFSKKSKQPTIMTKPKIHGTDKGTSELEEIFISLKETPNKIYNTAGKFIASDSSDDPLLTATKTKVSPKEKIWMKREEFVAKLTGNPTGRSSR